MADATSGNSIRKARPIQELRSNRKAPTVPNQMSGVGTKCVINDILQYEEQEESESRKYCLKAYLDWFQGHFPSGC